MMALARAVRQLDYGHYAWKVGAKWLGRQASVIINNIAKS